MSTARFCVSILATGLATGLAIGLACVSAQARDCADEFGEIARLDPKFGSKKRQSFIFKNEKRKFGEEFHLRYAEYPDQLFPVRFERISTQDSALRNRLKEIKRASRPGTKDEREVGELVVRPFVGQTRSARYSSNNLKEISEEAQAKAIEEKSLFRDTLAITHITDIHTHPNLGAQTNIFFSDADMKAYLTLKKQIEAEIDRGIHYRAILLPNCDDCDDVVLIMDL